MPVEHRLWKSKRLRGSEYFLEARCICTYLAVVSHSNGSLETDVEIVSDDYHIMLMLRPFKFVEGDGKGLGCGHLGGGDDVQLKLAGKCKAFTDPLCVKTSTRRLAQESLQLALKVCDRLFRMLVYRLSTPAVASGLILSGS